MQQAGQGGGQGRAGAGAAAGGRGRGSARNRARGRGRGGAGAGAAAGAGQQGQGQGQGQAGAGAGAAAGAGQGGGRAGWRDGGGQHCQGLMTLISGTSTGLEENVFRHRVRRGCHGSRGCGEAGERAGWFCAIEVEGLKRRPPTEVGGLGLEFRVFQLDFNRQCFTYQQNLIIIL